MLALASLPACAAGESSGAGESDADLVVGARDEGVGGGAQAPDTTGWVWLDGGGEVGAGDDGGGEVGPDLVWPQPRPSCVDWTAPTDADDPEAPLFAQDCVVDVEITMAVADWEALRHQTRPLLDVVAGDCLAAPPAKVFTWFPAHVAIGGVAVDEAAVRKKGFVGSLDEDKPSLKLDFNHFVPGQTLGGAGRMTLNNMKQDPGLVTSCIAYEVMTSMGVPAPRCNFARVSVNGADLGVFAHVEAIKGPLLRRLFGDDSGDLYEGTRSDFREAFRRTWQKKNHEALDDWTDLDGVVQALTAADDSLLADLTPLVDLDAFYTFWAAEVLLAHWDGYSGNLNNFYLYADPADGGRFRFIPWGVDSALHVPPDGLGTPNLLRSVYANGSLARRLYDLPEGRAAYLGRLKELLAGAWDEDGILAELDRLEALLLPELPPGRRPAFSQAMEGKRSWVRAQADVVGAELSSHPLQGLDWPFAPPTPACWKERGTLSGSFDTVWGSVGVMWPAGGQGTLALTLDGSPYALANVSANARLGTNADTAGQAIVEFIGKDPQGAWVVVWLIGPPEQVSSGTVHPVDWAAWRGWVARTTSLDLDGFELLGLLGGGEVSFQAGSTVTNDPLVGSFETTVYSP